VGKGGSIERDGSVDGLAGEQPELVPVLLEQVHEHG
jgi:hypothetical protein